MSDRKLKRNKGILQQYEIVKQTTTCRKAMILVADMYGIGYGTVNKILFDPTYPNSPLPQPCADTAIQATKNHANLKSA